MLDQRFYTSPVTRRILNRTFKATGASCLKRKPWKVITIVVCLKFNSDWLKRWIETKTMSEEGS